MQLPGRKTDGGKYRKRKTKKESEKNGVEKQRGKTRPDVGTSNGNHFPENEDGSQSNIGGKVSYSLDSDVPQVEWQKMDFYEKNTETGPCTSTPTRSEPLKLMSFWDLVGSERTDNSTPGTMLQLEAPTEMISPHKNTEDVKGTTVIEVDLTAGSPSDSPEVSLVAG